MAKDSIGSLALYLSADSSEFANDLNKASSFVQSFATKAKAGLSNLMGGGVGGIAGSISAGASKLKELFDQIPVLGPGTAALAGVFSADAITGQINRIAELGKAAKTYGLTITEMSGLANVPGLDLEDFGRGMKHFNELIGEAQIDPKGEKAIQLRHLGQELDKIVKMSGKEVFFAIADKIAPLASHFEKAKIAGDLFGKSGDNLLPALGRGGKAMQDDIDRATRLNRVLSESDAERAIMAKRSQAEVDKAVTGVGQRAAIFAAPFLTGISASFASGVDALQKIPDLVGDGNDQLREQLHIAAEIEKQFEVNRKLVEQGMRPNPIRDVQLSAPMVEGAFGEWKEKGGKSQAEMEASEKMKDTIRKTNEELEKKFLILNKTPAAIERIKAAQLGIKGEDLDKIERKALDLQGKADTREREKKNVEDRKTLLDEMGQKLFSIGKSEAEITVDHAKRLGIMGEELESIRRQAQEVQRKQDFTSIRNKVAGELTSKIGQKSIASDALVKGSQEDITFGAQRLQPRFTVEDALRAMPDAIKSAIQDLNILSGITAAIEKGAERFAASIQVGVIP